MTQTSADLVNRILSDLNVVGLGQTPSDEDFATVAARITTIAAELTARGITYLPDVDSIDDTLYEPLVELMTAKIGTSYGRPAPDPATILMLEERLKEVSRPAATRRTLQTDPLLREGNRPWRPAPRF